MRTSSKRIKSLLSEIQVDWFRDEYAIQNAIAEVLESSGIAFQKEYELDRRNRVDFLIGEIVVEVKAKKPNSARLAAQIARYAEFPEVSEIIIVVERNLFQMPELANGKSVHYVSLSSNFGFTC